MKKHLFWIYIAILEINTIISMLFQYIPRVYYNGYEGQAITENFEVAFDASMIIMFLIFEMFLIASFFVDELGKKRKVMALVFFINIIIVSELYRGIFVIPEYVKILLGI
jgi:hypothetical protein